MSKTLRLNILALAVSLFLAGCTVYADPATVEVYAWNDENCNGVPDTGESPLQGVCVVLVEGLDAPTPDVSPEDCDWDQVEGSVTDEEGFWYSGFVASSCSDTFVAVRSPEGFAPTTSTVGNGCEVNFGFATESTCTPNEP